VERDRPGSRSLAGQQAPGRYFWLGRQEADHDQRRLRVVSLAQVDTGKPGRVDGVTVDNGRKAERVLPHGRERGDYLGGVHLETGGRG
jgi:hypothetical protein